MTGLVDMFVKNKMLLIIIGVVIGGFVLYRYTAGAPESSLIQQQQEAATSAEARAGERAILDTLFQLRAITLSGNIFNNPAFVALRDFRTEIVAEPIGRSNPFAPISGLATSTVPARQIDQNVTPSPNSRPLPRPSETN